jgi:FPC/CPF motif-containing protein YcgG
MHCSPCYRQYLDARRELSALDAGTAAPRRMQKEIARRLDKLEKTMKSLKNLSA